MTADATPRRDLAIIVAMGPDRAIGVDGALPWRLPEDLKRFQRLTTGHAVIMGRRTFESIGRPLPRRRNIVITRSVDAIAGVEVAASFESALELAYATDPCPFVIGGAKVYEAALPLSSDLHVTRVDAPEIARADTFFPAFDAASFDALDTDRAETPGIVFLHYRRKASPAPR